MTHRPQQRKGTGFTIIEVMIVLAIAGLILVIVFLAVPSLQRTSRNTQRKDDASAALAAVNEYATNNGGQLPKAAQPFNNPPSWIMGAAGSAQATARLGYYNTAAMVSLQTAYSAPAAQATDTLTIYEGTQCTSPTQSAAGTSRQIAAVFGVETSSGYSWQCQES